MAKAEAAGSSDSRVASPVAARRPDGLAPATVRAPAMAVRVVVRRGPARQAAARAPARRAAAAPRASVRRASEDGPRRPVATAPTARAPAAAEVAAMAGTE